MAETKDTKPDTVPTVPRKEYKPCPYDGIPYSKVPGYIAGFGCPVCKGISFSHILIPVTTKDN